VSWRRFSTESQREHQNQLNPARTVLDKLGVHVSRRSRVNRFQAMEQALRLLAENSFEPKTMIDAGANVGDWTLLAREIFPDAAIHMIEPQSGCASALQSIASSSPQIRFHQVAVTRPGVPQVSMAGGGPMNRGTGAWVLEYAEPSPADQVCEATTLDDLIPPDTPAPILLKLDLEGHEMPALEGAESLLRRVEVVVTEVSLFDINDSHRPLLADILGFLKARGFDLYDIASLSARSRDGRLRQADIVFVRHESPLSIDHAWE
jgi:FkbM family methyltransferase